ncbi:MULTISPECIES: RNA polymerase sigma factor [Nocardioides]|uniref:RNA polymerase sigma factor n=1 Tax=Nocardioides vastitatis TaxID=2568655 RepID=A0ABW0ZDP5_9ACTN|nr:sigma-70 family RNA polymerase sigma factor [Nocardioides sp.]THI95317.1 sigma-70 family RNA polymerase sigma factor [Nocardioides sp.]
MSESTAREETFRRLYAEHFDAVLGFALRRCDRPEDAGDVTADTFVVAWRRLRHVPEGDGTRPWLYGVARRVLANHRRGEGRRAALGDRLRHQLREAMADISEEVVQRADVSDAMSRLSARDEEVLQLHLWEGLESREIAEVLGLPGAVVRPRLSRAKVRLRDLLGNDPPGPGHLPSEPTAIGPKEGNR